MMNPWPFDHDTPYFLTLNVMGKQDFCYGYDLGTQNNTELLHVYAKDLREQDEENGIEHDPHPLARGFRLGFNYYMRFLAPPGGRE